MREAEKKLTTAVAPCRTEVIVHSPPAWIIIINQKAVLWKSKLIKQVMCIVKEKGERTITELGFKRERQRGQRGVPRPGFMVGSWWYILPLLSFPSYTSLVPIFFYFSQLLAHRLTVTVSLYLFSFIKPFKTLCLTILFYFCVLLPFGFLYFFFFNRRIFYFILLKR